MNTQQFVLLLIVACAVPDYVTGQCNLNYKDDFDFNNPPPVFMTKTSGPNPKYEYMDPDTSGSIIIASGGEVVISCPGKNNYVKYVGPNSNQAPKNSEWVAKCDNGKTFKAFQLQFNLIHLSCIKQPEVTIKDMMDSCEKKNSAQKYSVGYIVEGNMFPLYEVCFDKDVLTTYFAKKIVYPYSDLTTQPTKQSFQANNMFVGVSMDKLYTKTEQTKRFDAIFGSSQTYTVGRILEKGHLVSRADFVMAAQVRATYQYINAGPQWNAVNAPRWASLEKAVRKYVLSKRSPATVYTGTFQVLSLPKTNTASESVYLTTKGNKNVVPVPMYFYKVVKVSNEEMVFVTINWDNTIDVPVNSLRFCQDKCGLIWNDGGLLSFCCEYKKFVNIIGYDPK